MNKNDAIVDRDLACLWHPCSQMKDYETFPPLAIASAKGSHLLLQDGRKLLDAISSWWCKNLGHGHPRLIEALTRQAQCFDHVILANTTNDIIVNLSEKLVALTTSLKKVFYASDGSCAVEIAVKMVIHARYIRGQLHKNKIMALSNSYHGETLFTLALSDVGIYRRAYEAYLPPAIFLQDIPYVTSVQDELWRNCEDHWLKIQIQLEAHKDSLSAIIIEPILQGAGGMRIYSANLLTRLKEWCQQHDIYLIADEIMTGFGRTGTMLACQHGGIEPDFICLGKGLTGGVLPMSAVLTSNELYALFYDDYETGKSFLHSHTHSGNVLAAAVALECLRILEEEDILSRVKMLTVELYQAMQEVVEHTKKLTNLRAIGAMVAADLTESSLPRAGYEVYREAVARGVLLRPLGNTLYWLPPFTIQSDEIIQLRDITIHSVQTVLS